MKTIEEAAKEYANIPIDRVIDEEERYFSSNIKEYDAFKKGAEFTQQWIPVEEELPTCDKYIWEMTTPVSDFVIVMYDNGEWDKGLLCDGKWYDKHGETGGNVTHWRPIEIK